MNLPPTYKTAGPVNPWLTKIHRYSLPVGQLDYPLGPYPHHDSWKNNGGISDGELALLYDLPRLVKGGNILNIGTFEGGSAITMAQGLKDRKLEGKVYTIDIGEDQRKTAEANFERAGVFVVNIYVYRKAIGTFAEECRKENRLFNSMFIDGDHRYEGVKIDIDLYKDLLVPGGIVAFHDTNQPQICAAIEEGIEADSRFELILWIARIKCYLRK